MVFSTEDQILIKVLRPTNSPDLNTVDYHIFGETTGAWRGSAEVTPDRRM